MWGSVVNVARIDSYYTFNINYLNILNEFFLINSTFRIALSSSNGKLVTNCDVLI